MWLQLFAHTGISKLTGNSSSKCRIHHDIVNLIIKDDIGTTVINNGKEMACCQSYLHCTSQEILFTLQAHFLWYNNVSFLFISCIFTREPKVDNKKNQASWNVQHVVLRKNHIHIVSCLPSGFEHQYQSNVRYHQVNCQGNCNLCWNRIQ